jgi:hypothetical protein
VSEKAAKAVEELKRLLLKAQEKNNAIIAELQSRSALD